MDKKNNNNVTWREFLQDPYIAGSVLLMVLVSVPFASSAFDAFAWMDSYSYYFDTPILALTALALWSARRKTCDHQSRRFWGYLTAGFLFWLAIRLSGPLLTSDTPAAALATDLLYLAFYIFLILAFQRKPHLHWRDTSVNPIRQLESTGATLFGFGLLVYFIVIPATFHPSSLLTNIPSVMMYVVLNLYLFTRAVMLRISVTDEPWRGCYNWLMMGTAGFVLLDGFDLATRINNQLNTVVEGTLFEALWLVPLLGFIAAARCYVFCVSGMAGTGAGSVGEDLAWKWRGKLTYFAILPPLIHITLEILGWSDVLTRTAREVMVVFWILAAAGLSVLYDRRLLHQQLMLERRHQRVNQQLAVAQRMDAVRRMAGGIAHDFNNLLMVIQGFADVLVSRLRHGKDRSEAEEISKAARRAGTLTQNLLAIGRNEKVGTQPFQADQVLAAMKRTLQQQAGSTLRFELDETGYVRGDQGAFEDAVLNLVLNAREAITSGGTINISTGKFQVTGDDLLADTMGPGNYGYVAVEDDGEGMDEETKRHLFEPFFSNREGGTGLGLSMAYTFAHEAGGTIEVDSTIGRGSRFRIILPSATPLQEKENSADAQLTTSSRATTVLLVEDEASVRSVLKRSLENAQINVLEACNGEEALKVLHDTDETVDIVVSDVVMPTMDGGSLARRLQETAPTLPIIFMTGYSSGQLERLGDWPETTPILKKPFAAKELLVEIERSLVISR